MMATRERPRQRQDDDLEDDSFLVYESAFDLDDDITDEDIEDFLEEQAEAEDKTATKKPGFWNLQTGSGLMLIGIGTIYLLQQLGFLGLDFSLAPFVAMLPWLAGILIILTGFGVLSWSPSRRRKRARQKARERRARQARRREAKTVGRKDTPRQKAAAGSRRSGASSTRSSNAFDRARQSAQRAASEASRTAQRMSSRRTNRKKRLMKSRKNKKIAGVAAGIANYLGIDPTLVRIAFVIGAIFGQGFTIPLYIIMAFVLPKGDDDERDDDDDFIRVVND